jgi:UrcA family protein
MKIAHYALALLAALPLQSQAHEVLPEVRVTYADLDLRTEAGVKKLDKRLVRAARAVCDDSFSMGDLGRKTAAWRCAEAKIRELRPQRNRILAHYASPIRLTAQNR